MDEKKQSIFEHLSDLRKVVLRSSYGLALSMAICYVFSDYIMHALRLPMEKFITGNNSFVVLAPQEYFFTELKASLMAGILLASPWIFAQVWSFIAPGLYKNEKKFLVLFVLAASLCFVGGVLFAYFLVFPPTFDFFISSLPPNVHGNYSIGMLYGFAITILLALGVIFQTPIAVFLLVLLGLVSIETFAKSRPYVIVGCFIVGALLTPPDPITQIMLALPAYGLFEAGLLVARLVAKKSVKEVLLEKSF